MAAGLLYDRLSYDLIGNLPAGTPSVVGTRVLQQHFPAGILGPVTVLVVSPGADFAEGQGRDCIEQITKDLNARKKDLGPLIVAKPGLLRLESLAAARAASVGPISVPESIRRLRPLNAWHAGVMSSSLANAPGSVRDSTSSSPKAHFRKQASTILIKSSR